MTDQQDRVHFVERGKVDHVVSGGIPTDIMVAGAWTDEHYCMVDQVIPPWTLVPAHSHENEDQFAYVLEGELWFRVGEDERLLGPGGGSFRPKTLLHAVWNASDEPARMLELTSPGRFDEYFRANGQRAGSLIEMTELAAKLGITRYDDVSEDLRRRFSLR